MHTSVVRFCCALFLVLLLASGADEFHPSHIAAQQFLGFLENFGTVSVTALSVVPFEEGL